MCNLTALWYNLKSITSCPIFSKHGEKYINYIFTDYMFESFFFISLLSHLQTKQTLFFQSFAICVF